MSKEIKPATEWEKTLALATRAENGDKSSLPELRKALTDPRIVDVFGGDLGQQARLALLAKYSGKNLLVKETITRKLESMRLELAGTAPTPLEMLLVERVLSCWLHLHHLEAHYALQDEMTLTRGAYYQRCISAAQKRYLAAIKTLALVRKLAVPVLQVNIARKQVNVATSNLAAVGGAG